MELNLDDRRETVRLLKRGLFVGALLLLILTGASVFQGFGFVSFARKLNGLEAKVSGIEKQLASDATERKERRKAVDILKKDVETLRTEYALRYAEIDKLKTAAQKEQRRKSQ